MNDATLDRLAQFDSATIANAIESFGVRDRLVGYVDAPRSGLTILFV